MDYCDEHKECKLKIIEFCKEINVVDERLNRIDEDLKEIRQELWLSDNSVRSRVKAMEGQEMHLEKIILENRQIVGDTIKDMKEESDKKLGGLFKIFVLTIAAASLLIMASMGIMWMEIKALEPKSQVHPTVYVGE